MTIKRLEQYRLLQNEIARINKRIEKLNSTPSKIVSDSVRGSSHDITARERIFTITGLDQRGRIKQSALKKTLEDRASRLCDELLEIELFISTVTKSDIRQIIEFRFIHGLSWAETSHKVYPEKDVSEDAPRKVLERFFVFSANFRQTSLQSEKAQSCRMPRKKDLPVFRLLA